MDSDPVRAPPGFCDAVNVTGPLPLPLAPDVIVSHGVVVVDVHAHPAAAATVKLPGPPAPGTETLGGVTVYEQGAD